MKRVLIKVLSLVAFLSIVTGTTIASLSDFETSNGNQFSAGKIDLKIDSECHYYDCNYGVWGDYETHYCPPACIEKDCGDFGDWDLSDLTYHKFFNFPELTIGDHGEDTISYHVEDNDAYGCLTITAEESADGGCCNDDLLKSTLYTTGIGNCAENDGYPPEQVHKIEWSDSDTTKTYVQEDGCIITVVYLKVGTECLKFTSDTVTSDYTITGIGTTTVTVTENSGTRCCKDISHTEYVFECGCDPLKELLWFFGWYDDGDNLYEPYVGETVMFGPIKSSDWLGMNIYTLADHITGAIPAGQTRYIGISWCVGTMNVNHETGQITCNTNDDCVEESSGSLCLDFEFSAQQSRHNSNFVCTYYRNEKGNRKSK